MLELFLTRCTKLVDVLVPFLYTLCILLMLRTGSG